MQMPTPFQPMEWSPSLFALENAEPAPLGPWNGPSKVFSGGRFVCLVVYGRISAEDVHSIWIDHQSTYGDIVKELATIDATCTFTVLEPIWGPTPRWAEANPKSLIGNASQVLYAVVKDDRRYIVGVVRTSLSDYPVAIFESPIDPSRTVIQAIIASHPELKDQIKSITGLFEGQSGKHTDLLIDQNFKSVVIINASGDPPTTLMAELPIGSVPPLLRVPFAHCESLMKQAYDLEFFALQIIHILRAILHIVISLAKKTEAAFKDDSSDVETALLAQDEVSKWLRATPMLARNLQEILDRVEELMGTVTTAYLGTMQKEIEKVFEAVCGDYPGAVDVRHSHRLFTKLSLIDREEDGVPIRSSGAVGTEVTQPRGVLSDNGPSPKLIPSPPPPPSMNSYQPLQHNPTSTLETSAYRTPSKGPVDYSSMSTIVKPPPPMPGPSGSLQAIQPNINAREDAGVGISQYQCIHCGLKFDRPGRLEAHLNTHSDVGSHLSSPIQTSSSSNMGFTSTEARESHPKWAAPNHNVGVLGGNSDVPSQTPYEKPDAWRLDLKTLADRNGLAYMSEEHQHQQGFWSSYYLTNPDGSKSYYLGSDSGKTKAIAREHAAKRSYGTLTTLINTWAQTATASSATSTSAAVSTHADLGSFWLQELKRLANEKGLRFVCDQLQDSQGTWWATYHLTNPDGSKYFQLGSRGAAASNIAMEHAAQEAVETLNRWIATWPQPGTAAGSSGAGGSSS